MKPITIIGTGNVAWQLGKAIYQAGIPITQIFGRDATQAETLAIQLGTTSASTWQQLIPHQGIFILCVKDDAIAEVAASLLHQPYLLVHTSGAVSMSILESKAQHIGVFYPLQSLHRNRVVNWKEIPVCLEASSPEAINELSRLASHISDHVTILSSDERRWLHLAAVFVSNFTNFLYIQAETLCEEHGLSFDLLQPLILETAQRLKINSPHHWQTGPARRNDSQVINLHLQMLKDNPSLQHFYREFSESIVRYYQSDVQK
ncbi:MAG: F420-dependent NADP oxidoreductase [Flavobacteriales bacterium]|nr:F420-dependent NADP oxidoreductase [Flavobacteriales bacterium]